MPWRPTSHRRPCAARRPAPVLLAAAALVLAAAVARPVPADAQDAGGAPVVVELFTSQGCSSCPPADRLLGELRDRPDVIALSLHVDYWDYIGWEDPFASPRFTDRQRAYARRLEARYVYTPQMVVDGRLDAVGSRRDEVRRRIAEAKGRAKTVRPRLVRGPDGARVVIPAGVSDGPAAVWLAVYDGRHETAVPRGENAGARLANYNVVRRFERIGTWTGRRLEIPVDLAAARAAGRAGCAILVQQDGTGPILGAARMTFAGPG